MDFFEISSDDCILLKAFKESESLREAAKLLNTDPAGVARRAQQISNKYGFLAKVKNRWQLTPKGLDLVAWTESCILSQKKILSGCTQIRIASTMWFAEEYLIPNFKLIESTFGNLKKFSMLVMNTSFEATLIQGDADYAFACHAPETPEIAHKKIAREKWIIITPKEWEAQFKHKSMSSIISELKTKPYIKHSDINLDTLFPKIGPLSDSNLTLNNLIGIRSAVKSGLGWSIVPAILARSYLKEGYLFEIYDESLMDHKHLCIWWNRNRDDLKDNANKLALLLSQI